jgi:hypothetical protein
MRKTVLTLFLICLASNIVKSQDIEPQVSEPVELMGVMAHTAGYQEYCMYNGGQYDADIDAHFKPYAQLPAVKLMQSLRAKYGISYDAVASMGIHLNIDANGKISLLEEDENTLEKRWNEVDKTEFLAQLQNFYTETHFHDFFLKHKTLYDVALRNYKDKVLKLFDQQWYKSFYGKNAQESYQVIIGFCCGGGNYGTNRHVKGTEKEDFAIVGYTVDKDGTPSYDDSYLSTLIHEFNHSFVNYLLDEETNPANVQAMQKAGDLLFRTSGWAMQSQAYSNWQTVVNESLVRAAVICYMLDHKFPRSTTVRSELLMQIQRNFRWMPGLVKVLRRYEAKRTQYPTFESYYPEIIKFFDTYTTQEEENINAAIGLTPGN